MDAKRTRSSYSGQCPEKDQHHTTGEHTRSEGSIETGINDRRPIARSTETSSGRREVDYTDRPQADWER